jgi:hypothetical protein
MELFRDIASTKRRDMPLDLPVEFLRNLMFAKRLMERERMEDLAMLLECVDKMVVILKAHRSSL